jgi:predicted phosphodiesterase
VRLALLSDIHGNLPALDAVLRDLTSVGVDRTWVLGDHVALGPEPVAVLERLASFPDLMLSRGNTDRHVVDGDLPPPTVEDAQRDPALVPRVAEAAASFGWTRGMLTATGQLEKLAALPLELRAELPDGTRLLGVHASPGRDDGPGLRPGQPDEELDRLLAGAGADLIVTGHTHVHVDRAHRETRLFNLGSVALPPPDEPRASYAVLDADERSYRLERRLVTYDHRAVRLAIDGAAPPGASWQAGFYGG